MAKPPSRPRPPSAGKSGPTDRRSSTRPDRKASGSNAAQAKGPKRSASGKSSAPQPRGDRPFKETASHNEKRPARTEGAKDSGTKKSGNDKNRVTRSGGKPFSGRRAQDDRRSLHAPRRPNAKSNVPRAVANPPKKPGEPQRIAKLLARAGIASRREIERMISEGRIAIDGTIIDTPATLLKSLHGVTVDGNAVKEPAPAKLFMFHKPAGCLTAERDPRGRKTIYDYLPADMPRVIPVGRLDYNTEGLLLLTTDGELKRLLELPSTGVERSYRARAFGDISQTQLEDLVEGIEIDGIQYGKIDANLERRTGRNQWVEMTLTEGKNREVRRVLEHFGLEVSRLIRTRYGPFELTDLPIGTVHQVRTHDLITFRKSLTGKTATE